MTAVSEYLLAYQELASKPPLLTPVEGEQNKFILNLPEIPGVTTPTRAQFREAIYGKAISGAKWTCQYSAKPEKPMYVIYNPRNPQKILRDDDATDKIIRLFTYRRHINYDPIKQHPFTKVDDGFVFNFSSASEYKLFRALLRLKASSAGINFERISKPKNFRYDNIQVYVKKERLGEAEKALRTILENPNEEVIKPGQRQKRTAASQAARANDKRRAIETNNPAATRQKISAPPFVSSFAAPASMPRPSTVDLHETPPVFIPAAPAAMAPTFSASFEMPLIAPPPPIPIVFTPFLYGNPGSAQFIMRHTMPSSFAAPISMPLPSAAPSFPSAATIMANNSGLNIFAPQQSHRTSLPASDLSGYSLSSYVQQRPRFY